MKTVPDKTLMAVTRIIERAVTTCCLRMAIVSTATAKIRWNEKTRIKLNIQNSALINYLNISTTRADTFYLHLHILQHSPSSWIWSPIGQLSLGQSCTGSCRVQLILPLSQAHSTQRLGRCEEPCEMGILLIWQPTRNKR